MIQFFYEYPNYQTRVSVTYLLFGPMNIEIHTWNGWSYANIRIQVCQHLDKNMVWSFWHIGKLRQLETPLFHGNSISLFYLCSVKQNSAQGYFTSLVLSRERCRSRHFRWKLKSRSHTCSVSHLSHQLDCERISGVKPNRNKLHFYSPLRKRTRRKREDRLLPPLPFSLLHSSLLPQDFYWNSIQSMLCNSHLFCLRLYYSYCVKTQNYLQIHVLFWCQDMSHLNLGHIQCSKIVKVKPEQQHCWQIQFKTLDTV